MGRAFEAIDSNEYQANASNIANGLDSRTNILASKNMEVEDIFRELGDEEELATDEGYPLRNYGGYAELNMPLKPKDKE